MTLGFTNNNLKLLLSQINSFDFTQLEELSSRTGIKDINSLWTLIQNGEEAVTTGNPNRIVSAIKSLISMLGTGESAAANKEVQQKSKNLQKLEQESLKISSDNESKITELINNISVNQGKIQEAIKTIQELGGDDGVINKAKEELDKQIEIVETNTNKLNNATTQEEKMEALNALKGASAAINNLLAEITVYQAQVEAQVGVVEEETKSVDESLTSITETVIDGQAQLGEYLQQGAEQGTENTIMATTGSINTAAGTTQEATGTAMLASVFTVAEGQRFIQAGTDKISAGSTRIQGATTNLASLSIAIGRIGSDIGQLANFAGAAGSVVGDVQNIVGQFTESLNPIITSFGSWEKVAAANVELEQAITDYESNMNVQPQVNEENNTNTEFNTEEAPENGNETNSRSFNFDVNKFKEAFETEV